MRQKKSSKIIMIIIIILVILISLAGIAYTYFATDTFKGNKELFFKYMLQMGEEQEGFIETELKQYFEKQKNTPYLDEGSIDANVTASSGQKQSEKPNSMNVTFDGQVDTANSQVIQNISLNYADNVKFPFVYKQIGDTIGFQTNHIGNKFIAVNKENLETDLVSGDKSTNRTNGLQKMQEFADITLTKEDLQRCQRYIF